MRAFILALTVFAGSLSAALPAALPVPAIAASLDDATLQQMLTNMGYAPSKLSKGFLVAIKRETWTYYVQLVLSGDGTKLGLNANMGTISSLESVTASQWLSLLAANNDIDPSAFNVDRPTRKLYIHRSLDNRDVTPEFLRNQIESFINNIKNTETLWKFAN
jgi:hypothetical protein